MSIRKGPQQRLLSMTAAAIENALCYCTTLMEILEQKEADTEVAEYHLSILKTKLDNLKTVLHKQSSIDKMNYNVIDPLIEQLSVSAQKRGNTTSLLYISETCTLRVIMESLITSVNKLLTTQNKDECSLDQLNAYLKEIKQRIADYQMDMQRLDQVKYAAVGALAAIIIYGLGSLLREAFLAQEDTTMDKIMNKFILVIFMLIGGYFGYIYGTMQSLWTSIDIINQGTVNGKAMLKKYSLAEQSENF